MSHICTNCNHVSVLTIQMAWEGFACAKCEHIFAKEGGVLVDKGKATLPRVDYSLNIGDSGVLDGELWTITGFTRQKTDEEAWWVEYHLNNGLGGTCFLSQHKGNWMLAKESNEASAEFVNQKRVNLAEGTYELYSREPFSTVYAAGFFRHAIPDGKRISKDFICPPYAMLFEISSQGVDQYKARMITRHELKTAFPKANIPYPLGSHLLTPLFSSPIETILISLLSIITISLLLLIQSLNSSITSGRFSTMKATEQSIMVDSFELNSLAQMLSININATLSNDWAEVSATLINLKTGEESYAVEEISEYNGYEWEEDYQDNTIKFCQVPPGKYILELSFFAPSEVNIDYNVKRGGRSMTAYYVGLIGVVLMACIGIGHYKTRWAESEITH